MPSIVAGGAEAPEKILSSSFELLKLKVFWDDRDEGENFLWPTAHSRDDIINRRCKLK